MNCLKTFLIIFFVAFSTMVGISQNLFAVSDSIVTVVKTTSSFVAYNYLNFENFTGESLQMKWRKVTLLEGPPEWELSVVGPPTSALPTTADSSLFMLPAEPASADKLLYQVFPNETAGHAISRFTFFPVSNPADSVQVIFDYTINEVVGTNSIAEKPTIIIHYDSNQQALKIDNQDSESKDIVVYDFIGRLILEDKISSKELKTISMDTNSSKTYIVRVGNFIKKIVCF